MDFNKWTFADAPRAFHINLHRNGIPLLDEPLQPPNTYFMFEETGDVIFGYSEPKVNISFRATDMKPSVKISYKQKINIDLPGLDKFVELDKVLAPYFPSEAFEETLDDTPQESWTPPGELLHSYKYDGSFFEIWHASLLDPKAFQILRNMKVLIPMFIEGGTFAFLEDDEAENERWATERWKVFFIYQVENKDYSLAGFSTSYSFSTFPKALKNGSTSDSKYDSDGSDFLEGLAVIPPVLPNSTRERISQFLILPPYQRQSHGINLYQTMVKIFMNDPAIFEITVEDPNESFDCLRDYCDLSTLLYDPEFSSLKPISALPHPSLFSKASVPISLIVPRETITALWTRHKLIRRQVEHLIELYILRQIPSNHRSRTRIMSRKHLSFDENDRKYYFWRLLVKYRVYVRNKEDLAEVPENERIAKMESSVDSLQEQYEQLIAGFESRVDSGWLTDAQQANDAASGAERTLVVNGGSTKKRKVVESSSDDEDEAPAKRQATEPIA
jgi:histone acetyltransferase 1